MGALRAAVQRVVQDVGEAWGEQNDVQVSIDLEPYTRLPALAAAEVKAQRGHDIFGFLSPPARYEDQVIDHNGDRQPGRSARSARYGEIGRRSTYNPKTKKYFGVSDSYVPAPVIWRHDLWNSIGESPASWDHVRAAAPALKALGHPIGIGQANELDSNVALISFLMCFGSFIQDESDALTIESRNTVEAVQFMADLYAQGAESTVFGWKPESNNQFLLGGKGSLIMNAISAVRRAEDLGMPIAKDLWMWPIPARAARKARPRAVHGRLLDLEVREEPGGRREVRRRPLRRLGAGDPRLEPLQLPELPRRSPARSRSTRRRRQTRTGRRGKYSILTTIASKHTRNVGYPGHANAAVQEALDTYSHPADVRSGLAGEDERRGLGSRDREGDEADLGKAARGGQDLTPTWVTAQAGFLRATFLRKPTHGLEPRTGPLRYEAPARRWADEVMVPASASGPCARARELGPSTCGHSFAWNRGSIARRLARSPSVRECPLKGGQDAASDRASVSVSSKLSVRPSSCALRYSPSPSASMSGCSKRTSISRSCGHIHVFRPPARREGVRPLPPAGRLRGGPLFTIARVRPSQRRVQVCRLPASRRSRGTHRGRSGGSALAQTEDHSRATATPIFRVADASSLTNGVRENTASGLVVGVEHVDVAQPADVCSLMKNCSAVRRRWRPS